MKTVIKLGIAAVIVSLVFMFCKVTSEEGQTTTMYSLKFEDGEISGWDQTGYVKYTNSDMFTLVNGGAKEFTAKGMTEGFQQEMKKGADYTYTSWIMDFGTEASAQEMYDIKLQFYASSKEAAGTAFPESVSFIRPTAYGYDGYAVFGKYLIIVWLNGYGTNKSEAKNNTVEFLETIKTKKEKLKL